MIPALKPKLSYNLTSQAKLYQTGTNLKCVDLIKLVQCVW